MDKNTFTIRQNKFYKRIQDCLEQLSESAQKFSGKDYVGSKKELYSVLEQTKLCVDDCNFFERQQDDGVVYES